MAGWLTRADAAALLRRKVRTVARMISDGELTAVKHGQAVYVLRHSIDDYVAKLESQAAKEAAARAKANRSTTQRTTQASA